MTTNVMFHFQPGKVRNPPMDYDVVIRIPITASEDREALIRADDYEDWLKEIEPTAYISAVEPTG